MKNLLLCLLLLFGLVAMSTSCNNKIMGEDLNEIQHENAESDQIDTTPEMIPHSQEEDCHGLRKTIMSVSDLEGDIMLIGNNIAISIPPGTKRYKVCEVPDQMKKEGTKVKFSGEVLEIFPNERLMGTPLRVSKIEMVKK